MKRKDYLSKQWWRVTLLLLTCLIGGSSPTWAIAFVNEGYTAITSTPANDNGTYKQPYFEMKMVYYDNTNDALCYWQSAPEIYVDGVLVCYGTEIGNFGANGGKKASEAANSGVLWWGNIHDKTVDGVTYRVRFHSPFVSQTWSGHQKYSCYMRVYISSMESNSYHEVRFKGQWMYAGGLTNVNAAYAFRAPTMWADNVALTADMTDYQTLSLSGNLNYNYGPTLVGLKPGGEGNAPTVASTYRPHRYVETSNLVSAKRYEWHTSTFSGVSYAYTRQNLSHKNGSIAAVEYSLPVEDNGFTTNFYKWYEVGVPGFALPKNFEVKSTNPWTKKIELTWDVDADWQVVGNNRRCKEGQWVIYRDDEQIGTKAYDTTTMTYTDTSVPDYDVNHTYKVAFVPKNIPSGHKNDDLAISLETSLQRNWSLEALPATLVDDDTHVKVSWKHSAIEDATGSKTYTLTVHRSDDDGQTWSGAIYSSTISSKGTQEGSYTDSSSDLLANHTYKYEVRITLLDKEFNATTSPITLGGSQLREFTASRGSYSNVVKLAWTVKQVGGEATSFVVARRPLGTEGNDKGWQTIHTVSGTNTSYSYEDNTTLLGTYNEYRVAIVDKTNSSRIFGSLTTDGFAYSTGVVSGRVKYGTGTAVEGVKVKLKQQSESGDLLTSGMRSLKLTGSRAGLILKTDQETIQQLFGGDFSVQMYVNPSLAEMDGSKSSYNLLHAIHIFYMSLTKSGDAYKLGAWVNRQTENSNLTIPADKWSHITLVHNHEAMTTMLYIAAADTLQKALVRNGQQINWEKNGNNDPMTVDSLDIFSIAGLGQNGDNNFRGYVDEFRFFTKALSEKEILRNYNHPLAGNEDGLAIYYPFDEGLTKQTIAYDYSKTNGVANGHHAQTYIPAYSESVKLPSEEQLCMMNYTDSLGNYTIRGIYFQGEGTPYSIIPEYNIHEFSPSAQSRFISASSLVHSGVDFEDVSSFPVSGRVFYAGTDYPVEGVNFYVDGTICAKNGELIATNAEGEFTISVPIGNHFIEARKNGHVFVNNGRFPEDPNNTGTLHNFDGELYLEFRDTTLVNFTGRVVGGDIEGEKPIGFARSTNNIGRSTLVLLPPNSDKYRLNVVREDNGGSFSYVSNPDTVPIPSARNIIESTSWRGAGADNSNKLFIRTDAATGEFSAMVPPLSYTIQSIKVDATGKDLIENSITLDLTQPLLENKDSLESDDGSFDYYTYHTILRQTYHSTPTFTVKQDKRDDGAYGINEYTINDINGELKVEDISTGGNYKFGYPVFVSMDSYIFDLEGFEKYENKDSGVTVESKVPLAGTVVTIANALSSEQAVYGENNEAGAEPGSTDGVKDFQLELDDEGKAKYVWKAGLPNISDPYTRTINIYYTIGNVDYDWTGNPLNGIVLGTLPTGNNFVTAGTDQLDMILRDPPGSNSSAEWSKGSVWSRSESKGGTWSSETTAKTTTHFGTDTQVAIGAVALYKMEDLEVKADLDVGVKVTCEGEDAKTWSREVTTTKTISTSDSPDYVGADGDIFIGSSTNLIFGMARGLDIVRDENDPTNAILHLDDVLTAGLQFNTQFSYTQSYIVNTLIPNFKKLRNAMITPAVTTAVYDSYVNDSNRPVYLSTLTSEDERFGSSNHDKKVWKNLATAAPSEIGPSYKMIVPQGSNEAYQDSVEWYNSQIRAWETYLAFNEMQKVISYQYRTEDTKNYSFDAGTTVNESVETNTSNGSHYDVTTTAVAIVGTRFGTSFNKLGVEWEIGTETGGGEHHEIEESTSETASFSFTLADDGVDDALSVDVYDGWGFSPIFRTRGGQTSAPYEGEVVTQYYDKGTTIMEGTMQIEVPQIDVDNPVVNSVPSGSAAEYTLRLSNASEIGADVVYRLFVLDETNPNGAQLTIDGKVLTESGRLIKVPANQTLTKTLQLRQTNTSVLDYEKLTLVFASDSEPDEIFSAVDITAHFIPSSSPVTLALSNTIMNTQTGDDLTLTFKDFDRNYRGLKAFRLQYKKQGSTDWTMFHEYVLAEDPNMSSNSELLPKTGGSVSYDLPMASFSDGDYLFRVVSVSEYGSGEITRESNEVALVKDMERPRPLGQPEPTDGIFDIGDEVSLNFNEAFLKGELTKIKNFSITGVLNGAEIAHETALSMQGTEVAAQTEASINLNEKDFSIDTWVNITGEGTLLSHGQADDKLTVGTDADGKLVVEIAGQTYTSTNAVPKNEWAFLTMNVNAAGKLNATVATANETVTLFNSQDVVAYKGNGPIAVGSGSTGAMHELLLWDEAHDMTTALLNRSKSKSPSTRHLIGYWKMDEGEGKSIRDYARNRHMTMPNETWYLNNENKAVALDGQSYLSMFTGSLPYTTADDYAIEFWMRGDKQTGEAQLLQAGKVGLWLDSEGVLQLTSTVNDAPVTLASTSGDLTDHAWHHIALNVLRQGAAAIYVDGERKLTTSASNVGNIATDHIIVGAKRTATYPNGILTYTYDSGFKGEVDEIRVWDATLNANFLNANRKVRLTGIEPGLVAYYPFETQGLNAYSVLVTTGTDEDFTGTGINAELMTIDDQVSAINYVDEAPALRKKPVETNVSFNFTASNEKIVIDIDEDPAAIEGCTLNFIVREVRDVNGNYSMPTVWSAFVNRKQLVWKDDAVAVEQQLNTASSVTATLVNKGGQQQMWTLSGLPSWITVASDYGTTNPLAESTVTFNIAPAAPLGRHEVTVYATDNDNIDVPLTINVKVTGEEPDWAVNPNDYELSMNVIATLDFMDEPSQDEDDIIGVFINNECRGVARPEYNKQYDRYFLTIDIYGNTDPKDPTKDDVNKPLEFKAYDASAGVIYPVVHTILDSTPTEILFISNDFIGRYKKPLVLHATDEVEQKFELAKGWNWMSLGVSPNDMTPDAIFAKNPGKVSQVKGKSKFAKYDEDDEEFFGQLSALTNADMYLVQVKEDILNPVTGHRVDATTTPITLYSGWNWIGFNRLETMSLADALAHWEAQEDDIIKGQKGVAYYDEQTWIGSLRTLVPGKGYMAKNGAGTEKTFKYPTSILGGSGARQAPRRDNLSTEPSSFTPVDFHAYPANMAVCVQVVKNGEPVSGIEVGIFAGSECREASMTDDRGMIYVTVPGDEPVKLTFRVTDGADIFDAYESMTYETDAVLGTPKSPLTINLDNATGIKSISDLTSESMYDISGRKVADSRKENHQLSRGVYIVNGQKVVVK